VIFFTPPKSIKNSLICNNHSEFSRNDGSSNSINTNINKNTIKIEEPLNSQNSNFINNPEYTSSCSLNNNLTNSNTNVIKKSKKYNNSSSLKTNDDSINSIENNDNILSNSFTNDSNLSEKIIESKSNSKPTKLNMVTTEPYPKYTPTVEKAIKKYENKQPKKECIVM